MFPRPRLARSLKLTTSLTLSSRSITAATVKKSASKSLKNAQNGHHKAAFVGLKSAITQASQGKAKFHTATIKGNNISTHRMAESTLKSDWSSMASLTETIPQGAVIYGAAGLIPYAATSLTTVYLAKLAASSEGGGVFDAETALALLHHVEIVQVGYGAIILSFLGSIHWGLEFAGFNGLKGHPRYLIGIAPVMLGWSSMLLPGQIALITQLGSFVGMWFIDQKATTMGWTPRWYSTYRFALTTVVASSLLVTIGGAAYYTPGDLLKTTGQRLSDARTKTITSAIQAPEGTIIGDIKLEQSEDRFVKFTNVPKAQEAERLAAEEQREAEKKAREERLKSN